MKITKKMLAVIITAVAAAAVIIAAVIFVPKILNRFAPEQVKEVETTVIKCNVGQVLSEADLNDVENMVKNIVGDKFKSVEKTEGFAPMLDLEARGYDVENMSDEEYEKARIDLTGDRLAVTCSALTEDEWLDIYSAIALHFDFELTGDTLHNREIRNIFGVSPD